MKKYIVYKYTSPSGKVYIGQTKHEQARKSQHRRDSQRGINTAFCKAIRKYGFDNLQYEVIMKDVPDYMINAFEKYWISYYNSCHGEGYNSEEGGTNASINYETRMRISKSLAGIKQSEVTKEKRNSKLRGQKRTEEQKANYRKAKKAQYVPVQCIETGEIYQSIADAQQHFGVNRSHVGSVCAGRRKTALGYSWKYITNM